MKLLSKNLAHILVLLMCVFYVYFLTRNSASLNEQNLQFGDFAAYDQVIYNLSTQGSFTSSVCSSVMNFWNTIGAKTVEEVPPVDKNNSVLGIHFIPALYITNALADKIISSPNTTYFMQSLAIGLTALFLYLIFMTYNLNPWSGFILSFSFLIHPATLGANINAFHPVIMALPFLTLAYFCIIKNYMKSFWILFVFCGLIQENLAITMGAFSLIFLIRKDYKNFKISIGVSLFFLILTTKLMIPFFNPKKICPYCAIYGSPLGYSMGDIIKNSFLKPHILMQQLFRPEVLTWFHQLLLPLIFLPLLSPILFLIAIAGLVPNLLSSNKAMLVMWGQYNALAMPFFYIGAGIILSKIYTKFKLIRVSSILTILILFASAYASYKMSVNPYTNPLNIFSLNQKIYLDEKTLSSYNKAVALIPKEASVSSTESILNRLNRRAEAFIFPVGHLYSDYLIIQKTNLTIDFKLMQPRIDEVISSEKYENILDDEYITVYKKI